MGFEYFYVLPFEYFIVMFFCFLFKFSLAVAFPGDLSAFGNLGNRAKTFQVPDRPWRWKLMMAQKGKSTTTVLSVKFFIRVTQKVVLRLSFYFFTVITAVITFTTFTKVPNATSLEVLWYF